MKSQKISISKTIIGIQFPNFDQVKPCDLITLKKEYSLHIPKLFNHLKRKKYTTLLFVRLEGGVIKKREMRGKISDINLENKSFNFTSTESFSGIKNEEGETILVRTDNVLGIIPILVGSDINPFQNSHNLKTFDYDRHLRKICELAKLAIDTTHAATIFYNLGNGKIRIVEGEIIKVNKSNIEIEIHRSIIFENGKATSVSLFSGKTVKLNISSEEYLYKIKIIFGEEHKISGFDDGEEF